MTRIAALDRSRPIAWFVSLAATLAACVAVPPADEGGPAREAPPPSEVYPGLFEEVALSGVIAPKDWVDVTPRIAPADIRAAYAAAAPATTDELARFVDAHFERPASIAEDLGGERSTRTMAEHIHALWPVLQRDAADAAPGGSLLALPHPYIVPGGRFREVYYWDAYFTMVGMGREHDAIKRRMVDNFAHLIATYGFIPNANRTYYLSRSQPPFFFMMVGLLSPGDETAAHLEYLDALRGEYAFWMNGAASLAPGEAHRRAVRLADGSLVNRYWDDRDIPRDESYPQDVETAERSERPAPIVFRNLRAAAESGWDFSSRWFTDGESLATVDAISIAPPDLNALLYGLERAIAAACARARDEACAAEHEAAAEARRAAMRAHLWRGDRGVFVDYDVAAGAPRDQVTAAALYPLFFGVASPEEARRTARAVEAALLAPGGLLTTAVETGEQWDAPNGWAPLHWIAVRGLAAYGEEELARAIAERWLATASRTYCETGKMVEKYDVAVARPGGGGEYPLQDGFGWTNGVTLALLALYPDMAGFGEVRPAADSESCAAAAE
ncbi:MAG: alpha,alpha-trehalase TreF [Caulobacterales bacterium]|nr:alpha,alpha-trehalase TreF [Caulobacterales bacterium]